MKIAAHSRSLRLCECVRRASPKPVIMGFAVRVAKLPMAAVLRTRTIGETRGYMKALVDAHSDRIVGFSMIGIEAGEVMAAVQVAMLAGMPYTGLRDAIMTHPTMAEGLVGLFSAVPALAN
jgi:pyruvate/2-oxoglutarate dehydrogenase complex dihydrolipoamide dehydrogenase (E3) component